MLSPWPVPVPTGERHGTFSLGHFRDRLGGRFQVLSYEQVFRARALPVGLS